MIQRIQTIYLLISIFLLGLIFWLPLAEINASGQLYLFNIKGMFKGDDLIFSGLPLILFLSLIVVLHGITLFSFRNRIRQIRILIFTMVLLLGLFGVFFWFAYMGFRGAQASFKLATAFPVIAIILDFLSIRAIGKDEALIRSMNRIR